MANIYSTDWSVLARVDVAQAQRRHSLCEVVAGEVFAVLNSCCMQTLRNVFHRCQRVSQGFAEKDVMNHSRDCRINAGWTGNKECFPKVLCCRPASAQYSGGAPSTPRSCHGPHPQVADCYASPATVETLCGRDLCVHVLAPNSLAELLPASFAVAWSVLCNIIQLPDRKGQRRKPKQTAKNEVNSGFSFSL